MAIARDPARLAERLVSALKRDLEKDGRLGKVKRYLKGDHDLPYAPRGAKLEYKALAQKAITNWLPLISDTYAKALFVDGYRPAKETENAKPWSYWQANGLDARQTIAHRGALEYGTGWVLVLPGDPEPSIRPLAPTKTLGMFEDDDAEWPTYLVTRKGKTEGGDVLWTLYDEENAYTVTESDSGSFALAGTERHGLGVCPVVRFRDRLDGEAEGIIAPLINLQDRINEAVFALMIAIQFASFRQRWATGLAIPEDDRETLEDGTPNPNFGKPLEPFKAAVDRLWVTDSAEAKFGDFAQTEVSGHLNSYESAVRTLAAIAQISPHVLMGDLVNLAADALAAINDSTTKRGGQWETLFGESWEQVFRLAAAAAGDKAAASDKSAQVRWRDSEARSLAQTVDALGKMAQMLQVPVEALWERVPGVTQQDVEAWKKLAKSGDSIKALADALSANAEKATASQTLTSAGAPAAPPIPSGA